MNHARKSERHLEPGVERVLELLPQPFTLQDYERLAGFVANEGQPRSRGRAR